MADQRYPLTTRPPYEASGSAPRTTPANARTDRRHHRQPQLHPRSTLGDRAGLQPPTRKLGRKGCRDRRSSWPPPWSSKDVNTPTFDTLLTSPRPSAAPTSPQQHGKTQQTPHHTRKYPVPPGEPHPYGTLHARKGLNAERGRPVCSASSAKTARICPMVKSSGGQRESDGVILVMIDAKLKAPGAKRS